METGCGMDGICSFADQGRKVRGGVADPCLCGKLTLKQNVAGSPRVWQPRTGSLGFPSWQWVSLESFTWRTNWGWAEQSEAVKRTAVPAGALGRKPVRRGEEQED